jgi:hypothetical protein
MSEEKNFPIEKHNIFLFQVFDLQFFTRFFILTTVSGFESELFLLRIRIQPKLSDSFGFGSTTLSIWFRFDLAFFLSDPHPWSSYASLQYNFLAAASINFSRPDNTYFTSLMHLSA